MTYVIRKIAYEYNDTFSEIQNGGDIDAIFYNYDEAYTYWRTKEIAELRRWNLYNIQPVASWDGSGETIMTELEEFLHYDAEKQTVFSLRIPPTATDDEVWEVRRISGIRFYTLSSFEGTPHFYVIRLFTPFFDENELVNYNDTPILYNTYEEAINDLTNQLMYFNLKGTPEELSDMPDVFRQLVDSHPMFVPGEQPDTIDVVLYHYHSPEDNAVLHQFIEILKEKPLIIERISMDTIRKVTA